MGHTVWSQRIVTDIILGELQSYKRALRPDEQEIFTRLLARPLEHIGSIGNASSIYTWVFMLLSIMIEQEKKIRQLEELEHAHRCLPEQGQDCCVGESTV